ncbi:MAG: DUF4912 domain-containing protein [Treponema sp.]|jgi:hypothetical protein|nr:DUF4912 domain-containing protein [Treponema sp.]
MDDPGLTRPYLESLSTDELVKLADRFGVDIPFGLERIFIIEELLDLALGDEFESREDEEENIPHADFLEAASLPRQYYISFIEVLIRDPLWAFVFWEIKGHDKEIHERAGDFGGYFLQVVPVNGKAPANEEDSFTVPVGIDDTAWYLGFPPAEGSYQVGLCALHGDEKNVLTVSRPFRLPRLLESPVRHSLSGPAAPESFRTAAAGMRDIQPVYRNPLACLSGAKDFAIIRSADRVSRVKGISD